MKKIVKKESQLLEFLMQNFNELSNKKIKSFLKYGNILVNEKIQTKYDYLLRKNDVVSIKEYKTKKHDKNLEIIYEDKDIIVIDKPSGLPTISTIKNKEKNLYHMVSNYVKQVDKKNKIYVIHRLDKDTSGIVMFAKNIKIKNTYQENWDKIVMERRYIAIVEGTISQKKNTIQSYLKESNMMVYSTNKSDGKLAITKYEVIDENKNYSMLKVNIETGRKNQIRVHLKEIGYPIIGDKKYGSNNNILKRLGLHANVLKIKNPITKKINIYESNIPKSFKDLLK